MNENKTKVIMDNQSVHYQREVFRSRYSVILIIIIVIPLISMANKFFKSPNTGSLIHLLIFTIVVLFVSGIRYVIVDSRLIFKTWFINCGEISILSIEKVERTYFVLSSNAGSLKRLWCELKKGSKYPFLLISPKNEERFFEKLKKINPNIKINVYNKKGFYRFWDWDI